MQEIYCHYYKSSNLFHGSLTGVMGTQLDVLFLSDRVLHSQTIWKGITRKVTDMHQMLNRFDPASELSRINRNAFFHPTEVNHSLLPILIDCRLYHQRTLGYFDITLSDYSNISLNTDSSVIRFLHRDTQLDMGGYAKGYTLEIIRDILIAGDITHALVNFGNSSVLALGSHPHGDCWPIGVIDPFSPEKVIRTFRLKDESLSTSGNSTQRNMHIINPFDRKYNNDKKIISVVAPNAVDAEVLSTALYVCPPQKREAVLSSFTIKEYFIQDSFEEIDAF